MKVHEKPSSCKYCDVKKFYNFNFHEWIHSSESHILENIVTKASTDYIFKSVMRRLIQVKSHIYEGFLTKNSYRLIWKNMGGFTQLKWKVILMYNLQQDIHILILLRIFIILKVHITYYHHLWLSKVLQRLHYNRCTWIDVFHVQRISCQKTYMNSFPLCEPAHEPSNDMHFWISCHKSWMNMAFHLFESFHDLSN